VEALSEALGNVKRDGVLNGAENWSSWLLDCVGGEANMKAVGVAGSRDFGWGGPSKWRPLLLSAKGLQS